ncbi:MAG: corrinoid protein [Defluviitaleaceae bacterium]|nr:corrinoid protein [Defluviitaleaceae bacterium]
MSIFSEISEALQKGKKKAVIEFVQNALNDGISAKEILDDALLSAMEVIGEKFKNNEIFVPEVLMAAKAMNEATALLKPHLAEQGVEPMGKAIIGTVKGDMHDIGKNLVALMMEGKGIEVIDLGVDVSAEKFYEAFERENAKIIACSSLITTTMGEMKNVVDYFIQKGKRDQVQIMVGGALVTDAYRQSIGADLYSPDAATAADLAKSVLMTSNHATL